jgi:hypothetical protein
VTTLSDYQFEILPSDTATDGVVFGIGSDTGVDMLDGGFIPGDDDWTNDDQEDTQRGGTRFGRDRLKGPLHGFDLFTNCSDEATALDAKALLRTAWRALSIRQDPSTVIPVRYRLNGRERRFYGRPRRFSAPPNNQIQGGYIPITADFQAADAFFYDDQEQGVSLTLHNVGTSDGGFIFPVIFPVTALPVGTSQQQLVVGGDAPAYPVIRVNGPVTNPIIATDSWTIAMDISLGALDYVVIDTRPWERTVIKNGNQNAAGSLSVNRRLYLSDVVLEEGSLPQISFSGNSASGAPTCTVSWRNTYNSY